MDSTVKTSFDQERRRTRALLGNYDRPGPRYTSYPAAPHFKTTVRNEDYAARLKQLDAAVRVALYVHIPFCAHRCKYCGCSVIPTRKRDISETYLDSVATELRLVGALLASTAPIDSLHLGGGTPTYLRSSELEALFTSIRQSFSLDGAREISVELDPRVTSQAQLEVLRDAGANRVSLGVQDTSPVVQNAIGRYQNWEQTRGCFEACRETGFEHINVDLVYGLPHQTQERWERTLADVLSLRPERLAIFAYAHVPWVRPNQKAIDPASLPGAEGRLHLILQAHEELTSRGYVQIGLDHYALPGDDLERAQVAGTLGRNFMGYTPAKDTPVLGFGLSAIGDLEEGYFQNEKKLSRYSARLERQELPVERGWLCSSEDRLRRLVIHEILCNLGVDYSEFERRFGVPFLECFGPEQKQLLRLEDDGLVELATGWLRVTSLGRLFVRNIAMVFDSYLNQAPGTGPQYSRTV